MNSTFGRFLLSGAVLAGLVSLAGCCVSGRMTAKSAAEDIASRPASPGNEAALLIGTYTEGPASSGKSKGIYTYRFDTVTGDFRQVAVAEGVRNPSWLVVSRDTKFVYAVNELNGNGKAGEVSAFAYDAPSGKLTFLDKVSSQGDDPCHLFLDNVNRRLFVSNYSSGNFAVIPVNADGRVAEASQTLVPPGRDDKGPSHVHSIVSPGYLGTVIVQDLGADKLTQYRLNEREGAAPQFEYSGTEGRRSRDTRLPSGTGPRHLVRDTVSNRLYLIGELNDSVSLLGSSQGGPLYPEQTVTLGVPVTPGKGTAAAIHLSEDGRFLYASTRNPKNLIVVFEVNPADGKLREIQTVSSGGKAPREFTIAPGGRFLLAANQQSDAVTIFRRDPETGKIENTGRTIDVGTPVDLKWAPAW